MKKNQTLLISSLVLLLSVFLLAQFLNISAQVSGRPKPTSLMAKERMVLPIKATRDSPRQAVEQRALVQKVEDKLINADASLLKQRPHDERILADVSSDPHQVPASLLDFAVVVSQKMGQAKKNYVYAEALFKEFQLCALEERDGYSNIALRAYCLANAKRLVAWYPDLMGEWLRLSAQVGRQLMDLVDLQG